MFQKRGGQADRGRKGPRGREDGADRTEGAAGTEGTGGRPQCRTGERDGPSGGEQAGGRCLYNGKEME